MTSRKRVLLITGAAGGIGRATVQVFHQHGWIIIGVDRNDFGEGFPESGLFIRADISDPRDLESIYEKARAFSPLLDAVVHNAALQIAKRVQEGCVVTIAADRGERYFAPMKWEKHYEW